ncbi:MAG: hypothetical protein MK078_01300 [Crocinitomicaceae bacterium]|nr:hypothetical protein [Crocinitomicaceae bacterium]
MWLFLLLGSSTNAQTIVLGSGTTTNGVTTNSPINIWNRKTVAQMVYTVDELNAAGISGPATINQLGFFIGNPGIYPLPDYTIQMKHTNAENASGNLEGGYTTIKSAFDYSPGYGWDMLTLDTPFDWNGTQNIVLRVCWSRVTASDPSGQVRIYNFTSGYKYRGTNGGGSACNQTPNTVLNTKPQLKLIFETTTVWTGEVNEDTSNPNNWSAGLPDFDMDVLVPGGTPNDPDILTTLNCRNFTNDGTVNLSSGGEIVISQDLTNNGSFNDAGGLIRTIGTDPCQVIANTPFTIQNVIASSSGGTSIAGGMLTIGNELLVAKGDFNTGDNLIINSDVSGTGRIAEIRTTCTYTLTMTDLWGDGWNGGFLEIYEEGALIETFSGKDASSTETFIVEEGLTFELVYTSGFYENENAYTLTDDGGTVIFSDGTTPATGTVFTYTAAGCSFSPTVIGNVTMERYIDAGETYWRYFSSAVNGATIEQYNDDFLTAGYPGSTYPSFTSGGASWPSIYTYDETAGPGLGYNPVSSAADVIATGEGLQVWCGDTITGTTPFLVDLTGPANQGNISLPVSYTFTGSVAEDGYCLVGNPYPSTIDWDSPNWIRTSNIANAVYIQNPDTKLFASYVAGASTNGGSRYIASQQAFWVSVTGATPAPNVVATERVKSDVDATFFKASESVYSPGMTISVYGDESQDQTVFRHIEGSTDSYDSQFDAVEYFGGWGVQPQISLINEIGEEFSIQSLDLGYEEWAIPMRVVVFETGVYSLSFENTSEVDVPCMRLEDLYTGDFYDVSEDVGFEIELYDSTFAPRFLLHVGRNVETEVSEPTCFGENDGAILLDLNLATDVEYSITSAIGTEDFIGFGDPLLIENLESGIYTIEIPGSGGFCGVDNYSFAVTQPNKIDIDGLVSHEIESETGEIYVNATGGTAPYAYVWSDGGVGPLRTTLGAGIYEVEVTDGNGCTSTEVFEILATLEMEEEVSETEFFHDELNNVIQISGALNEGDEFYILNALGQRVYSFTINPGTLHTVYLRDAGLSAGTYMLVNFNSTTSFRFVNN